MEQSLFYSGNFGLERETLRIDAQGRLAQTSHPFGDDQHITRDFCENQIELITPVCHSIKEVMQSLRKLHDSAEQKLLESQEKIWLYSNPPHFESEQDIPIARFAGEQSFKQNYREALEKRYGKRLMLFSGIHFNFSFSDEFLNGKDKNKIYLQLYQQLFRHSWLLVLLTAASPVYDKSLDGDGLKGISNRKYASLRNSHRGYWNQFIPILNHSSLKAFTESIQEYVNKGLLFSASELYLPIRLKPRGDNSLENLLRNGIDHIELRMFDLNPLCPLGIDERDLQFAHLLILYLLNLREINLTPEQQEQAVHEHQSAALYQPDSNLLNQADKILTEMQNCFQENSDALSIIDYQQNKLKNKRLCEQIRSEEIYTQ